MEWNKKASFLVVTAEFFSWAKNTKSFYSQFICAKKALSFVLKRDKLNFLLQTFSIPLFLRSFWKKDKTVFVVFLTLERGKKWLLQNWRLDKYLLVDNFNVFLIMILSCSCTKKKPLVKNKNSKKLVMLWATLSDNYNILAQKC